MNQVFEKTSIGGMVLENRIIRSATCEGWADDEGYPENGLLSMYESLARNKAGAIVTGYVTVQRNGRTFGKMGIFDDDKYIEIYKNFNKKIREYNVPLILQIAHGGGQCFADGTKEPVAPSSVSYPMFPKPRALSETEIEEIINSFTQAVVRAKKAEFSGVQVHAAHGYLLSSFLSPHFNRRKDRWGGSTENRFRIVGEIIRRARQRVGNFPILVKISAYEEHKDGLNVEESIRYSKMLQEAGCDAIEVSCGDTGFNMVRVTKIPVDAMFNLVPEYSKMPGLQKKMMSLLVPLVMKTYHPLRNYNVEAATRIKEQVTIPVIAVGGIRKLQDIKNIIGENKADYVSMCRPFIIEPDIVSKFISGKQDESRCIDCGFCVMGLAAGPLKCYYGKVPKRVSTSPKS
jgi:2,4-dienoyl-CoA reductase-like NADH-dependent reductase (Old Yellow Enzyme family)